MPKNLELVGGVPNCKGSAAYFSRRFALGDPNRSFVLRSHQDGERAKVDVAGNTGGSKLRGISLPDRESVREGFPFPHENGCGILK